MTAPATRRAPRTAVVGAGLSGLSAALAMKTVARLRGLSGDVHVFGLRQDEAPHPRTPVVLTPECRSRLVALGCTVSPLWRKQVLSHIEVRSGDTRVRVPLASNAVWVVDDWPHGQSGQDLLAKALTEALMHQGARQRCERVTRILHVPKHAPANWMVEAKGWKEPFERVILAPGVHPAAPGCVLGDASVAPSVATAYARLRESLGFVNEGGIAQLWLCPRPGMDALLLLPCADSLFAQAFGPSVTTVDLSEALMMAARDGAFGRGVELTDMVSSRIPCGAGRQPRVPGSILLGTAAAGHPLSLGLRNTLIAARGAATLLLGPTAAEASQDFEQSSQAEGVEELVHDARVGRRLLFWLRLCQGDAAHAFLKAKVQRALGAQPPGAFGPDTPSLEVLLRAARREALRRFGKRLFGLGPPARVSTRRKVHGHLIYVVDDDAEIRQTLAAALEARGAEVVSFADEFALLGAVAQRPPHAVLLDIVLSRVDGLRLCRALKAHPLTAATRVFLLSGYDRPHIRAQARDAGADAFLSKPVDVERLWRRVQDHAAPPDSASADTLARQTASA